MSVRWTLWLGLLGLLCCSEAGAADRSDVRVEMGGIKQTRFDRDGKPAAVMFAERASVDPDGMCLMEGIEAKVYNNNGEEVAIRASTGKADMEGTKDAIFEGDIRVSFSDLVATTTRATWHESDGTVRGNGGIIIEGRGSKIIGSGFAVFAPENKAVIYRPRGTINLKQAEDSVKDHEGAAGDAPSVSRK
jgi:hypothetical protein